MNNVAKCKDADELYVMSRRIFDFIDKDGDGYLDAQEL